MTTTQRVSIISVLVLLLAGGGVFAWMKFKPTTTNANHVTRTNSNAATTTTSAINANTTPDNTNTSSATVNITVAQALTNPEQYNGRKVCITGHYEQTYTISAFGVNTKPGSLELLVPEIWVYPIVPTSKLQCSKNPTTKRTSCYGDVTVCSTFVYKPNGGIGGTGAFHYALDAEATAQ